MSSLCLTKVRSQEFLSIPISICSASAFSTAIFETLCRIPEGGLLLSKGVMVGSEHTWTYTSESNDTKRGVKEALKAPPPQLLAADCGLMFAYPNSETELASEDMLS